MANKTNLGTNGNLSTDLGGSFSDGDSGFVTRGDMNYSAGLDLSGTDFLKFVFGPGYVGNPAGTVKLTANRSGAGKVELSWGGRTFYLASSSAAGVIQQIDFNPASGGTGFLSAMNNEILNVLGGTCIVDDQCDVNYAYAYGGSLQLLKSGPTLTQVMARAAAAVMLMRDVGTIDAGGMSTVRVLDDSVTPATVIMAAKLLEYRGGNIGTALKIYSGDLDFSQLPAPITVADRQCFGPSRIILARNGPQPTWTATTIDYFPPEFVYV